MSNGTAAVKLSAQRQDGRIKCYKKFIGGRLFYLTADQRQSERLALVLVATWQQLEQAGRPWNEEAIAAAYQLAGVCRGGGRMPAAVGRQRLYEAIQEHLAEYKGRVSAGRYQRHVVAMAAYKAYQADVPLGTVTADTLGKCVSYFRARPRTSHGSPMAVATVATTVKAVSTFFDWADATNRWEAPRRFEKLFRIQYQHLKTPAELRREGNGAQVFTREELMVLWHAATPRQRLYLGLGLNIGETAQGIADLTHDDFLRHDGVLVVDRHRGKTGVHGVYPLWPEVASLVAVEQECGAGAVRAFLTNDGNPLVWYLTDKVGRVDSIAKTWQNLLKKCDTVRPFGFATLRKTGASMIRELTGSVEVSQTYLSHKGSTVAEKHYLARRFDRLAEALVAMREYLSPLFAATAGTKVRAA